MNQQKKIRPLSIFIMVCLLFLVPFYLISIRSAQGTQVQESWRELRVGLELEPHELRSDHLLVASLDAEGRPQIHYNQLQLSGRPELAALIDQVYQTSFESGTLKDGTIYFMKIQEGDGFRIALFDAGPQQQYMRRQVFFALISGIAVLLPIFLLYLVFRGWTGRRGQKMSSSPSLIFTEADRRLIGPHRLVVKGADRLTRARNEKEEERLRQLASSRSQSQVLIPLLEELLAGLQKDSSGRIGAQSSDFSFLAEKAVQAYEPYFYRLGKELDYGILPGLSAQGDLAGLLAVPIQLLQLAAASSEPGSLVRVTLDQDLSGSPLLQAAWDGPPVSAAASKIKRGDFQPPAGNLPQLNKAVKAVRGRLGLHYREGQNQIRILLPRALIHSLPLPDFASK